MIQDSPKATSVVMGTVTEDGGQGKSDVVMGNELEVGGLVVQGEPNDLSTVGPEGYQTTCVSNVNQIDQERNRNDHSISLDSGDSLTTRQAEQGQSILQPASLRLSDQSLVLKEDSNWFHTGQFGPIASTNFNHRRAALSNTLVVPQQVAPPIVPFHF